MRRFSRWLRAEPRRLATLLVFSMALFVAAILLSRLFNVALLTVVVVGFFVLTVTYNLGESP